MVDESGSFCVSFRLALRFASPRLFSDSDLSLVSSAANCDSNGPLAARAAARNAPEPRQWLRNDGKNGRLKRKSNEIGGKGGLVFRGLMLSFNGHL